jgi:chemotaxis response regulator CheB
LRSLTGHWDGKLIAVIVSGYDGDGADALCGIEDVGGITIAQKPETAGQPDMPASAIASGCKILFFRLRISPVKFYESRAGWSKRPRRRNLEDG